MSRIETVIVPIWFKFWDLSPQDTLFPISESSALQVTATRQLRPRRLGRQRARWQKGLLDVLRPNRDMLFRPRYGRIGCLALPYLWLFELFASIIEIVGIMTIVLAACLGVLSREFALQFLIFLYAFATVISIGSVLQEEITYKRYNDWQDVIQLVSYCFLEHFPYRQMHMIWRLQGLWQYLRGDLVWKPMKRKGLQSAQAP